MKYQGRLLGLPPSGDTPLQTWHEVHASELLLPGLGRIFSWRGWSKIFGLIGNIPKLQSISAENWMIVLIAQHNLLWGTCWHVGLYSCVERIYIISYKCFCAHKFKFDTLIIILLLSYIFELVDINLEKKSSRHYLLWISLLTFSHFSTIKLHRKEREMEVFFWQNAKLANIHRAVIYLAV